MNKIAFVACYSDDIIREWYAPQTYSHVVATFKDLAERHDTAGILFMPDCGKPVKFTGRNCHNDAMRYKLMAMRADYFNYREGAYNA